MIKPQARGVSDSNLIRREIYNRGESELTFILMLDKIPYIKLSGISVGPKTMTCKPKEFVILNHAFYIVHAKDGRAIETLVNYGDKIGVRNTLASNPGMELRD